MITLALWTQVWRDVNAGRHVASKSQSRWRGLARRGALVGGSPLYVGIARLSQELVETFYHRQRDVGPRVLSFKLIYHVASRQVGLLLPTVR